MSEASDKFNALPIEQRKLLIPLMLENELRLIAQERKRIAQDYRRAMREHYEREKRIVQEINRLAAEGQTPLPHWQPCNPACDGEFNGARSRLCSCEQALAALGDEAE